MHYKIIPLHIGTMLVDKSNLTSGKNAGVKMSIPVLAWLIEGGKEPILVDTGASGAAWSWKHHNPMHRPPEQEIDRVLAARGYAASDIKTVVNTHLHWDHCFNNHLFPNAVFLVQRDEWEYALDPLPKDRIYYETDFERPPFLKTKAQTRLIDGVHPLGEGLIIVPIPGHTPGLQGLAADTRAGVYFIASDAVNLWESWDDKLDSVGQIYYDLRQVYASLYHIRSIAKFVLPGHDPGVLAKSEYP